MSNEDPTPQLPRQSGIFKDRRENNDRRYRDMALRDQGRRATDRRRANDQFSPRPWWLRVNYLLSESANLVKPE